MGAVQDVRADASTQGVGAQSADLDAVRASLTAALRAGYAVVNVNPLYTPRELEHQLKDSGAEAIVILENFATTLEKVLPRTSIKHIIVGRMGDLLGFKGVVVNFVVRRIKKMVPAYSLPGAVSFNDALFAG